MIFISTTRRAMCGLLLIAPFVFVLSLPWVDLGVWRQTETAAVGLHLLSGLTGLFLAFAAALGAVRARAALFHPTVLAFAAIGAVSLAAAAFAATGSANLTDGPRLLHGLLKHGVGGLWHFDVAILTAGYLVTSEGNMRRAYAVSAGAAAMIAVTLTAVNIGRGEAPWVPYDFRGWLGVLAPMAATPFFVLRSRRFAAAGFVVLFSALVVGHNATAIGACLAAAGVFAAWHFLPPARRPTMESLRSMTLAASVVSLIGIAAALPFLPPLLEKIAVSGMPPVASLADGIPSASPIDHVQIETKPYGTVWSRGWMLRSVFASLASHPSYLLTGRGWGSFPQVYSEQERAVPGRDFAQETETASRTFWDPHTKADFHSHNMLVESLLSLGIAGAMLTMLALLSPLLFSRRRDVPAAAFLTGTLCIISGMWFMVNTLAPFLALAFASPDRLAPPRRTRWRFSRPLMIAATAAVSAGLIFSASILFGVAIFERQARAFAPMDWGFLNSPPCAAVKGFGAPAREINTTLYRRFVDEGESQKAPFFWFAQHTRNAVNYACIMNDLLDHAPDASTLEASLELRYRMLTASGNFPVLVKALDVDIRNWPADIKRLLAIAPSRTDVMIPYVSWLLSKGDKAGATAAIDALTPLVGPDDPVGFWLRSRKAEITGDEAAHKSQMVQALRRGIANFVPLRKADTEIFIRDGASDHDAPQDASKQPPETPVKEPAK